MTEPKQPTVDEIIERLATTSAAAYDMYQVQEFAKVAKQQFMHLIAERETAARVDEYKTLIKRDTAHLIPDEAIDMIIDRMDELTRTEEK